MFKSNLIFCIILFSGSQLFSEENNFVIEKNNGEILYAEDVELYNTWMKLQGKGYDNSNNKLLFKGVSTIKNNLGEIVWTKDKIQQKIVKEKEVKIFDTNLPQRSYWTYHNPKDPYKAGLLSLFLPSGDHVYNEQYGKGLFYLFGTPIIYFIGANMQVSDVGNEGVKDIAIFNVFSSPSSSL